MKKLFPSLLVMLISTFLSPLCVSADDGPTCVHVDGVEVSINRDQTQVNFTNRTDKAITINWEVWSNDPNFKAKRLQVELHMSLLHIKEVTVPPILEVRQSTLLFPRDGQVPG